MFIVAYFIFVFKCAVQFAMYLLNIRIQIEHSLSSNFILGRFTKIAVVQSKWA